VVIAIIAILAAMLFPVFARARESARKIQCLSNVKNVAMAMQMYLTDYDRFPPDHVDQAALAAFRAAAPRGQYCSPALEFTGSQFYQANPFLRWPVILDEYIRNRDIWTCPSARYVAIPTWIIPDYGGGPWYQYLFDNSGAWGSGGSICSNSGTGAGNGNCLPAWPPGWGGAVTDSIAQQNACDEPDETGGFKIAIGVSEYNLGMSTSRISDPVRFVVCADNASGGARLTNAPGIVYGASCCPCGPLDLSEEEGCRWWGGEPAVYGDPTFRKTFSPHMGGINIGFADGHARWWSSESFMASVSQCTGCCPPTTSETPEGGLLGICPRLDK